jgi:predicted PP-loop superfamily ATPase
VNDVRSKLSDSQTRVEDNLSEMNRNTISHLDNLLEELNANSKKLFLKIETTETQLEQTIAKQIQRVIDEVNYVKGYLDEKLNKIEVRLNGGIDESSAATAALLDTMSQTFVARTQDIEHSVNRSEQSLLTCTVDSSNTLGAELKAVQTQAAQFQMEIKSLHEQVVTIQEKVSKQVSEKESALQLPQTSAAASTPSSSTAPSPVPKRKPPPPNTGGWRK